MKVFLLKEAFSKRVLLLKMDVPESNEEGRHSRPPLTGAIFTMTVVQTPVDRRRLIPAFVDEIYYEELDMESAI